MTISDKLTLLASSKEALRVKLGLPENLPLSEYYKYALTHPDTAILDLFAGGEQGVWYDPSDKSTLFQDVAGTVPVTKDGDPVALIRDKSGNSNHATQSVSTARPIYKTDGVLHWLQFDGVDDILESASNFTLDDGFYACSGLLVREYASTTGTPRYFAANYSIFHQGLALRSSGSWGASTLVTSRRSGAAISNATISSAFELNERFVHSGGHDSSNNLYVEKNMKQKVIIAGVNHTPAIVNSFNIGSTDSNLNFYGGVWIDSSLDNSKDIEKYFASKTGVEI